jgi:disulfide bond formation protein DsbB
MANLVALIFVVLVLVLGIGACWAITANGAATTTSTDTFGDHPPTDTIHQNNASSGTAVKTMPVLLIGFFVMICVILVAGFAWLWGAGKSKASKY